MGSNSEESNPVPSILGEHHTTRPPRQLFTIIDRYTIRQTQCFHFRYDDTTGTFTVPPGGAGYYYFSTNLVADDGELGIFDIVVNGSQTCSAIGKSSTVGEYSTATCGIAFYIEDGMC